MTVEKAQEILTSDVDYSAKNAFAKGVKILAEVAGDSIDLATSLGHDQIWIGNFEELVAIMTEDQVETMASLNWFEDEDSWSRYS